MALVADYSDSDSELDQDEQEETNGGQVKLVAPEKKKPNSQSQKNDHKSDSEAEDMEVDEYDNYHGPSVIEEGTEDIPGLSTGGSLFESLPSIMANSGASKPEASKTDFVDTEEDLASIPQAKESEKALIPMKPNKKKRTGPVKIMLPSLKDLKDDAVDDEAGPSKPRFKGSKGSSALLSMLPAPKNAVPSKMPYAPASASAKLMVPDSVGQKRPAGKIPSSLVPRQVVKAKKARKTGGSDSEDSDGDAPDSFFTLETPKVTPILPALPSSSSTKVKVNSEASIDPEVEEALAGPSVGPSMPNRYDMKFS